MGANTEYHIIDGQQRLTTVTILLIAMRDYLLGTNGKVSQNQEPSEKDRWLAEQIASRFFKIYDYGAEYPLRLRPVSEDKGALLRLFNRENDGRDKLSRIEQNYEFFLSQLQKRELIPDKLFEALGKLEIISITLGEKDNAQLIFESLNSTGLALTEGDKIRNFILMGLNPKTQSDFYTKYWIAIEKYTGGDTSPLVKDWLSIKMRRTPNNDRVYQEFKAYVQGCGMDTKGLLEDLVSYARLYEVLSDCSSGLVDKKARKQLDACLYRLSHLEITVTRPFFMEVLMLNREGKLADSEVPDIFRIIECYLFRRAICGVPTNALNKIFVMLNKDVLKLKGDTDSYSDILAYLLMSKQGSGRFPCDEEFAKAISEKDIYLMRGRYREYLFEWLENGDLVETKDVYAQLEDGTYSIEHIMPQNLSPVWKKELGADADTIHALWLHRLANLTLSGYNSSLSNRSFADKRDAKDGGYKSSGLRMNQVIAQKKSWGVAELEERDKELTGLSLSLWPMPKTGFKPAEKPLPYCTLDDEETFLTGKKVTKYNFLGEEQRVADWADLMDHVVETLYSIDKTPLTEFAASGKSSMVSTSSYGLRSPMRIDEGVYIEKNLSTSARINLLRAIFALYDASPSDLVFFLSEDKEAQLPESKRERSMYAYWEYALPLIQKSNFHPEGISCFQKVRPRVTDVLWSTPGIRGIQIGVVAITTQARVEFHFDNEDKTWNKRAFHAVLSHSAEIERTLGIPADISLEWKEAPDQRHSIISLTLGGVSVLNGDDWDKMADFHAEWSDRLRDAVLPYLQGMY